MLILITTVHGAQQRSEDEDVELFHLVVGGETAPRGGGRDRPGPHGAKEVAGHRGPDRPLWRRHRHGLHRLSPDEGGMRAKTADREVRVGPLPSIPPRMKHVIL